MRFVDTNVLLCAALRDPEERPKADLGVSLDFYSALGYQQVGRISLGDGATLTVLKFPGEEVVTLELVQRLADGPVQIGTGFSHLAVQADELAGTTAALLQRGLQPEPEQHPAGPDGLRTSWLTDPSPRRRANDRLRGQALVSAVDVHAPSSPLR